MKSGLYKLLSFGGVLLFCFSFLASKAQEDAAYILYGDGVRAFYAQEYETALFKYNECLRLKPDWIAARYNRGLTFLKLDRIADASGDFMAVIQTDSLFADAHYQLAKFQMDSNHYDLAANRYQAILKFAPNHRKSLEDLATIAYYKHRYEEAQKYYSQLLQDYAKDEVLWFKRGLAYFQQSDFEAAIRDFTRAYELNGQNTLALEQRAISYQRSNEIDRACADWKELVNKGVDRAKAQVEQFCGKAR